jgi:hypothetical protein
MTAVVYAKVSCENSRNRRMASILRADSENRYRDVPEHKNTDAQAPFLAFKIANCPSTDSARMVCPTFTPPIQSP